VVRRFDPCAHHTPGGLADGETERRNTNVSVGIC
jgi:hypothetical protein